MELPPMVGVQCAVVGVRESLARTFRELWVQGQRPTAIYIGADWLAALADEVLGEMSRAVDWETVEFMGVPLLEREELVGYVVSAEYERVEV